jgi:hypothetical protein
MRRRAPAAGVSDGNAVGKVILEGDTERNACQVTRVEAKHATQQPHRNQRRTARVATGFAETSGRTLQRRHHRVARPVTSPAKSTSTDQGDSRGMYAKSVTASSVGLPNNATRCVLRRRVPASQVRHGSAARPRDDSRRPSAESGLDIVTRWVAVQDVASAGASSDGTDRDANGRP